MRGSDVDTDTTYSNMQYYVKGLNGGEGGKGFL